MTRIPEGAGIREFFTANGLIASSATLMYEVPALVQVTLDTLICCNTHATTTNTLKLHLKPDGGTRRQFAEEALEAGDRLESREGPMRMNDGDQIHGEATNADQVTWLLCGFKEQTI